MTATPPARMAISAASSFVSMPPRPVAEGPAARAFNSGVTSATRGSTIESSSCSTPESVSGGRGTSSPSTSERRTSASDSSLLITSAARRSLSLKTRSLPRPTYSSSAVETVSFSLTTGTTPSFRSLSIVRCRLE